MPQQMQGYPQGMGGGMGGGMSAMSMAAMGAAGLGGSNELLPSQGFPACLVAALQHVTSAEGQRGAIGPGAGPLAGAPGMANYYQPQAQRYHMPQGAMQQLGGAGQMGSGGQMKPMGQPDEGQALMGNSSQAAAAISAAVECAYSHMSNSLTSSLGGGMGGMGGADAAYNGLLQQQQQRQANLDADMHSGAPAPAAWASQRMGSTESEADAFHRAAALLGGGLGGSSGGGLGGGSAGGFGGAPQE